MSHPLTGIQRVFIGGAGALVPLLLNLIVVDFEALLVNITPIVAAGWAAKGVALLFLGGGVAWMHQEQRRRRLFELGIIAPALVLIAVNASNLSTGAAAGVLADAAAHGFLASPAHAHTVSCGSPGAFSLPDETSAEEFVRGLTGAAPSRTWFVIVSAHTTCEDAQLAADWVESKYALLDPAVYGPSGGYKHHAVVVGANMTPDDAGALRDRAISDGLVGAHMWRLGESN